MYNYKMSNYLFEYQHKDHLKRLEGCRQTTAALKQHTRPNILARFTHFLGSLNGLRHIHIEVTFNYQRPLPETNSHQIHV